MESNYIRIVVFTRDTVCVLVMMVESSCQVLQMYGFWLRLSKRGRKASSDLWSRIRAAPSL